jgi:long-chain acyl-CoA synthetase
MKRVIMSSGYSIYPSQLENVIDAFRGVKMSCVIGVPDPYKMQRPKAFIVLEEGVTATDEYKNALIEHCRKNIARYAMPREFEFRDSLPKTGVGKIAYTQLEAEEAAKSK